MRREGRRSANDRPSVLMLLESNFTPRGGGGAESQVRTVALALKRRGHRVAVLTPLLTYGPPRTADRCFGLPVGRIAYPHVHLVGAAVLNARLALFLILNRKRWDVWHVHIAHHMGALACLLGSFLGKRVVVKVSGWWELENGILAPDPGLLRRIERSWLRRASKVQAVSTRVAAELEKNGFESERVLVLPNAVDTSRFQPCAAPREAGRPFVAVFVGRLVPEKDLTTLFRAWAAAFDGRADVRLLLVGGGAEEAELKALAQSLGFLGQVEFLGHRDRVEQVLATAHIGLLPSRIEGLSNTLLEFMACGLPTVASRVSGSEDFVRHAENGWLFPVGDVAALAACLRAAEALAPDALARIGRQARADVEAQASVPRVVGRLIELYRDGGS